MSAFASIKQSLLQAIVHSTGNIVAMRKTAVSNPKFASVWDAIEDTPEEAENMKLRSSLMMALKAHLHRTDLSQAQAVWRYATACIRPYARKDKFV